MIDVGTNRESLRDDPMYPGNRHARVRGERYDAFIDAYIKTAARLFPHALLQLEDFAPGNARRILEQVSRSIPHFQRRSAGHRRDYAGGGGFRHAGLRNSAAQSAHRDFWRGHRGDRHRRLHPRRHGPRRLIRRGRQPAVLVRGLQRACSPTTWAISCGTITRPTPARPPR